MKKVLASMAIGMASGVAGSYFIYSEYKKGNLNKMMDKVTSKAKSTVNKAMK